MKIPVVGLLLFLSSCFPKKTNKQEEAKIIQEEVEVVIEFAQSSKCDLKKGIYTVYFMEKDPAEVKFSLSNQEKEKISKKYYSLELGSDLKEIRFAGSCLNTPTLYTTVLIKSENLSQKIQISSGCDFSRYPYEQKAGQVNEFIKLVSDIINSKAEVRNAPEADIIYY